MGPPPEVLQMSKHHNMGSVMINRMKSNTAVTFFFYLIYFLMIHFILTIIYFFQNILLCFCAYALLLIDVIMMQK